MNEWERLQAYRRSKAMEIAALRVRQTLRCECNDHEPPIGCLRCQFATLWRAQ